MNEADPRAKLEPFQALIGEYGQRPANEVER